MTPIEDLVKEWLRLDRDPLTRNQITTLLKENNIPQLEARLRQRIAFGTAGLRARMEAGFSRMNNLTVIQTSQGLASYIVDQVPDAKKRGVVIGFDGRHHSEKFAKLAAAAFVAKGIRVWWLETLVHTPLVPFAIGEVRAAAGVMITASHNPSYDNGYKVYWENGCQIISPHDSGIASAILTNLEPTTWDDVVGEDNLLVEGILGQVRDAYFRAVHRAAFVEDSFPGQNADFKFVYTPMHGVGLSYMTRASEIVGLSSSMIVVTEQAHPDPNFSTVKFPNPEEDGALDLAIRTADKEAVDLILANDPDADRFSAAVKVSGVWHQLTGNQIGILLASHMLETYDHSRAGPVSKLGMLASTVSSRMLSVMAETEGFHFEETLTGFKWLGNVAKDITRSQRFTAIFAFEEAIGYMFPTVVYDKDGISAATIFLRACQRWADLELCPWGKLQSLYQRYGFFAEENFYLVSPSPEVTNAVFAHIRSLGTTNSPSTTMPSTAHVTPSDQSAPPTHPTRLGLHRIVRWRDLTIGYDSASTNSIPVLPVQKDVQMLTCELSNDVRFTVRASGTEPKIKVYIDARARQMLEAEGKARETREAIIGEWLKGDFELKGL